MTSPNDPHASSSHSAPGERLRQILSAPQKPLEEKKQEGGNPLDRLPRAAPPAKPSAPAAASPSEKKAPPREKKAFFRWNKVLPAFWTIASLISMTINIVLLVVVILLVQNRQALKPLTDIAMDTGKGLLSGLYSNFEKMDAAHIKTNIPVDSEIPVQFDLALNQETTVVLSQEVVIRNAHVNISTGLLNINAPATVTLPAGTSLPIILNLTVPVDTSVPVHLDVPVDIALNQTDLHEPFVGLQEVLKPLYCLVDPHAVSLQQLPICPP